MFCAKSKLFFIIKNSLAGVLMMGQGWTELWADKTIEKKFSGFQTAVTILRWVW